MWEFSIKVVNPSFKFHPKSSTKYCKGVRVEFKILYCLDSIGGETNDGIILYYTKLEYKLRL